MLLYILLGIIGFLVLGAVFATIESRRLAAKLAFRLQEMDRLYNDFAEKHLANHIIQQNNLTVDAQQLVTDSLIVLKPHINALIGMLNSYSLNTSIGISYASKYFPNIVGWCESAMSKKRQNGKRLSPYEEQELTLLLQDAVLADVQQRLLLL